VFNLVLFFSVPIIEPKVLEMGNSSSPPPLLKAQLTNHVSGSPSPLLAETSGSISGMQFLTSLLTKELCLSIW